MKRLVLLLSFAGALHSGPVPAQTREEALQRMFIEGIQQLEAGNLPQAESIFREMLTATGSPRVKLELARTLFLQGNYDEAKKLFQDVATQSDTPWRVRDNIQHFVRQIDERSGYLKLGVSIVSDSNPRNLTQQREFSIGGLVVTPTEAPKKVTGLRYSVQAWKPIGEPGRLGGYVTASYVDYPNEDLDRLTVDPGFARKLTDSGRVRGKAGVELGAFAGQRLYHFPYLGLDAVLAETETSRLTGELKAGKVSFRDLHYLDAINTSVAMSARKAMSQSVVLSIGGTAENSRAKERPYSYYGAELAPGIDTFWPDSAYLVGARAAYGMRKYAATDPLFGEQRSDSRARLDITLGNKKWRFRNSYVSLIASLERTRSSIEFYSYRKSGVSVIVE